MKKNKNANIEISDCVNCNVFDRCFPIGGDDNFTGCENKIRI